MHHLISILPLSIVTKKILFSKNNKISCLFLDPLDFNYTQLIQPLHYYPNQQEAPQALRDINDVVRKADGHIFVTPGTII